MAYCDYCTCLDCKTGVVHTRNTKGEPVSTNLLMTHAPTAFGDWICNTCWSYECCVDWQKILGEKIDPCSDTNCGHRPKLIGPFVR